MEKSSTFYNITIIKNSRKKKIIFFIFYPGGMYDHLLLLFFYTRIPEFKYTYVLLEKTRVISISMYFFYRTCCTTKSQSYTDIVFSFGSM